MSAITNVLAVWKPAVKNMVQIDQTTIIARTAIVAAGTIALMIKVPALTFAVLSGAQPIVALPAMAWCYFENKRCIHHLNNVAFALFQHSGPSEPNFTDLICKSPEIVKKMCKLPNVNFHKIDKNGDTLLSKLVAKDSSAAENKKREEKFQTFKTLIDHGVKLIANGKNLFLELAKNDKNDYLCYVIEKDAVKPTDLTEEQTFDLWCAVKNDNVARLLVKKGFNIDVKKNEMTPLQSIVSQLYKPRVSLSFNSIPYSSLTTQCALLMRHKATIPSHDQLNDVSKFPQNENSKIRDFLIQASVHQHQNQGWSTIENINTPTLDFKKPAIKVSDGNFSVDELNVFNRTMIVAAAALVPMVALLVYGHALALSLVAIPFIYYKGEMSRAKKALNSIAIHELTHANIPLAGIHRYLIDSGLVVKSISIGLLDHFQHKLDTATKSFWLEICNPYHLVGSNLQVRLKTFEKVARNLFEKTNHMNKRFEFFLDVIRSESPDYLHFVLKNGWISGNQLNEEQQFLCWKELSNVKSFALLKAANFTIEAKNSKGKTLLTELIAESASGFSFGHIPLYDHLEAILKLGAVIPSQISLVKFGGNVELVNTLECVNKQPAIHGLLQSYNDAQALP